MTEDSEPSQEPSTTETDISDDSSSGKKRKLFVGLDLGTLESCVITKLSKPGSGEHQGTWIPSIVGYPEDGILAGILPGNSIMLHGEEAIANSLHLRLVNPLSDGVVSDGDAARSFLAYIREKIDPERKREVYCVIGIPAVADTEAKSRLQEAAKGAFEGILFIFAYLNYIFC